jgi:hypothetical protein
MFAASSMTSPAAHTGQGAALWDVLRKEARSSRFCRGADTRGCS